MRSGFKLRTFSIEDANFENRGELLLHHMHEGMDLQPKYMDETLKNLNKIWKRPVNLITVMDNQPQMFRFDGTQMTRHSLADPGLEQGQQIPLTPQKP